MLSCSYNFTHLMAYSGTDMINERRASVSTGLTVIACTNAFQALNPEH